MMTCLIGNITGSVECAHRLNESAALFNPFWASHAARARPTRRVWSWAKVRSFQGSAPTVTSLCRAFARTLEMKPGRYLRGAVWKCRRYGDHPPAPSCKEGADSGYRMVVNNGMAISQA